MSARLSKEIIDCVQAGRYLLSAFEVEGPRLAVSFLEETRPHLEDDDAEPRPDGFLVAVARKLQAALDHLVETDHAVANATGWESELRQRRQAAKRQLAFLIVALRRMVLGQYEEPDMANLALEPVNVRDSQTVQRRAELVGERFEAENLAKMLGQPRFEKPVDLSPYVAELRTKAAELLTLTEEVNEAQRKTDRARITRKRAKEAYDRIFLRGARMFEDICRFCGLDELAARVRRRQGRAAVSDSEERSDRAILEEESRDEETVRERRAIPLRRNTALAPGGRTDLQDADLCAHAEVPGPTRGGPDVGPPQSVTAHPGVLSRLLRPLRRGRFGVRPERLGAAGSGARSGPNHEPTSCGH